jgi:hypothetical protein
MVVFYNPHVDDFLAEPPHYWILKRRPLKKYGFYLAELFKQHKSLRVLVDGSASAFIPERFFAILPNFLRQMIASFEFSLWVWRNRLKGEVERVPKPSQPIHDVLMAFSYKAATGPFHLRINVFNKYQAVIFHLSHYFISTSEKAHNLSLVDNVWLAGDSDIRQNDYFNHFFYWYKKSFLVMPFAVATRFNQRRDWSIKERKCIATGTFHDLSQELPAIKYRDFINFWGVTSYHPLRKLIFEQAELLNEWITCLVSPYRSQKSSSSWWRFLKRFNVAQKKYFSINLADLYDNHQFALVGEELSGFPALGAFEAMACGCVLFADPKYYVGLQMKPDVHYLPHDSAIDSVIGGIKSLFQKDPNFFDMVAKEGSKFIEENLRQGAVFSLWQRNFEEVVTIT